MAEWVIFNQSETDSASGSPAFLGANGWGFLVNARHYFYDLREDLPTLHQPSSRWMTLEEGIALEAEWGGHFEVGKDYHIIIHEPAFGNIRAEHLTCTGITDDRYLFNGSDQIHMMKADMDVVEVYEGLEFPKA